VVGGWTLGSARPESCQFNIHQQTPRSRRWNSGTSAVLFSSCNLLNAPAMALASYNLQQQQQHLRQSPVNHRIQHIERNPGSKLAEIRLVEQDGLVTQIEPIRATRNFESVALMGDCGWYNCPQLCPGMGPGGRVF
jgi:hypothetical protein